MKKLFYILIPIFLFSACNDSFLERYPLSDIALENSFKSATDLELFSNGFYNMLPGYSDIVEKDFISDNILIDYIPDEQSGKRVIPSNSGGWDWEYLRSINLFLANYERCDDQAALKEYSGVARFFRAWFYFDKIKRFGDVPWYSVPIGSADKELLTKPRDSRVLIVDSIIQDLDYAIENLNTTRTADRVSRWTALALKSRVCLFEGTFRKYHKEFNLSGSEDLLKKAAESAEKLMNKSVYSIYSTGNPENDYLNLFASYNAIEDEVILTRRYSNELQVYHNSNFTFTQVSAGAPSLTKSLVNSYLQSDGTPFTSKVNYTKIGFWEETLNRDKRLNQTIRTNGYKRISETTLSAPVYTSARTGYQITKFVTEPKFDDWKKSNNDLPIIRYAEVLLNFAEAKAELGTLSQSDINKSIKLLRDRVGMSNLFVDGLTTDPILKAQYKNASGTQLALILEIRRERRIELAMEGFRYDDLMRWKEGHLLAEYFTGAYYPSAGKYDLNGDGNTDLVLYDGEKPETTTGIQYYKLGTDFILSNGSNGNLTFFSGMHKEFNEERDYLYPLPSSEFLLNPNLTQNPGWN